MSQFASVNGICNLGLKSVVSVVLPDSLEVRLVGNPLAHLVRVLHLLHLEYLWSHLAESLPFSFELSSSFLSSGVHAKNNLLVLISTSEGVKDLLWVIEMAVVSQPSWMGYLVVEES